MHTTGQDLRFAIRILTKEPGYTAFAVMAVAGVLAGAAFGFVAARLAGRYFLDVKMPGALPVVLSAFVLLAAAVVASWLPAARVDVIQALRAE